MHADAQHVVEPLRLGVELRVRREVRVHRREHLVVLLLLRVQVAQRDLRAQRVPEVGARPLRHPLGQLHVVVVLVDHLGDQEAGAAHAVRLALAAQLHREAGREGRLHLDVQRGRQVGPPLHLRP